MDQGRAVEADRLAQAMETTRASITDTVGELRENVNRAVDWREQVKMHPNAALGAAAVGGLLLGQWLASRLGDSAGAAGPDEAIRGARVNSPLTRAGSRMSDLVNRVVDELADTLEKVVIPPFIARIRGSLPSTTTESVREPAPNPEGTRGTRISEPGIYPGGSAGRQSPPHSVPHGL